MTSCTNSGLTRPAGVRATRIWSSNVSSDAGDDLVKLRHTFRAGLEEAVWIDAKVYAGDFEDQSAHAWRNRGLRLNLRTSVVLKIPPLSIASAIVGNV